MSDIYATQAKKIQELQRETRQLQAENAALKEQVALEEANGKYWAGVYRKWVETDECARKLIELKEQVDLEVTARKQFEKMLHNQAETIAALKEQVAQLEMECNKKLAEIIFLKDDLAMALRVSSDMRETIAQQAEALRVKDEALQYLLTEKIDYMLINKLGDPSAEHGTKLAAKALAIQPTSDILRERDLKTNLKLEREHNERHSGQAPDDISL